MKKPLSLLLLLLIALPLPFSVGHAFDVHKNFAFTKLGTGLENMDTTGLEALTSYLPAPGGGEIETTCLALPIGQDSRLALFYADYKGYEDVCVALSYALDSYTRDVGALSLEAFEDDFERMWGISPEDAQSSGETPGTYFWHGLNEYYQDIIAVKNAAGDIYGYLLIYAHELFDTETLIGEFDHSYALDMAAAEEPETPEMEQLRALVSPADFALSTREELREKLGKPVGISSYVVDDEYIDFYVYEKDGYLLVFYFLDLDRDNSVVGYMEIVYPADSLVAFNDMSLDFLFAEWRNEAGFDIEMGTVLDEAVFIRSIQVYFITDVISTDEIYNEAVSRDMTYEQIPAKETVYPFSQPGIPYMRSGEILSAPDFAPLSPDELTALLGEPYAIEQNKALQYIYRQLDYDLIASFDDGLLARLDILLHSPEVLGGKIGKTVRIAEKDIGALLGIPLEPANHMFTNKHGASWLSNDEAIARVQAEKHPEAKYASRVCVFYNEDTDGDIVHDYGTNWQGYW